MRNKLFLIIGMLMMIGLVSAASPSFGSGQVFEPFEIRQECFINGTICDVCNITSIVLPNASSLTENVVMTQRSADFNYTVTKPEQVGEYFVNGYCTYGSDVKKPFVASFLIYGTEGGVNNIPFIAFAYIFALALLFFGVKSENEYFGYLSALILSIVGIYIMIYGFGQMINIYTRGIAFVSLGVGLLIGTIAGLKTVENLGGEGW